MTAQDPRAFRRRLLELLRELEATDEGQLVAGVIDYVRGNVQVAATTDDPRHPPTGPENEPQRPEIGR